MEGTEHPSPGEVAPHGHKIEPEDPFGLKIQLDKTVVSPDKGEEKPGTDPKDPEPTE